MSSDNNSYTNINTNTNNNGRINLLNKQQSPDISKLFQMYDRIPANQCTTYRAPLAGLLESSQLSCAFFSAQNIQIIQNGIRAGVYKKSKYQYIIEQQDCNVLKTIMRRIFLQNAKHQPTNITEQITDLNNLVLDHCICNAYSEAQGYMKYLHDASTLAVPNALPIQASQKRNKEQRMPNWF